MKIALAADFHLDMRQFNLQKRWQDYIDAFIKVTRMVKKMNADAYVIAGDVFDKYRPHPGIIRRFIKEVSNLECPIILIRGNHDSPQILFEKYGGDILHLIRDVSEVVYLNRKNPTYEMGDVSFFGLGYIGFNVRREIKNYVDRMKTKANIKVGIFHQLLDYPGVPAERAEISRGFLKGIGFDHILMGHYHVAYMEEGLFNPGSPEYWAFDQAEQIEVNLDTGEEVVKPAKKRGFFLVQTENGRGEFIEIKPTRPMFCITYETNSFEANSIPQIKEHLQKYDVEGAMVKSIIRGKHKLGQINIGKKLALEKPLVHSAATRLVSSNALTEKVDITKTQIEYLVERGLDKAKARAIARWLENNKERLAKTDSEDLLKALREILE